MEKHFTASALIIHEGKVLLMFHKKLGVWLYPGGHVEHDETPDSAVKREVMEETGLRVEIVGDKDENLADTEADISVLHNPYAILCEKVGDHYHNDLIYLCKIKDGNININHDPKESEDIAFFSLGELVDIKLFPNFRRLLEKVFKECV